MNDFLGELIASLSRKLGREVVVSEFQDIADVNPAVERGTTFRWTPQERDNSVFEQEGSDIRFGVDVFFCK